MVGPKKEALKLAEEELEVTMAQLRAKQVSWLCSESVFPSVPSHVDKPKGFNLIKTRIRNT